MTPTEWIIKTLGGKSSGMCKCPCHEDDVASLHVKEGKDGKVLLHCHAGCKQEVLIQWAKDRGLWPERRVVPFQPRRVSEEDKSQQRLEGQRLRIAYGILLAATSYEQKHPDSARQLLPYLNGRGIDKPPVGALYLPRGEMLHLAERFPEAGLRDYPAMLQLVGDHEDHFRGALVTFLSRDSRHNLKSKETGKNLRKTLGPVKGGFVQLSKWPRSDRPLIIGEGVETTLAAAQLAKLPAIAAAGASKMSAIDPPPCSKIIIAADNDEFGRKAAAAFAERLQYEGHKVAIALPPVAGEDWNDCLLNADDAAAAWRAALQDPAALSGSVSALEESEFMALTFPKVELLLAPWLPRPGLVMVHAARGDGKTYLALAVAKAVANGAKLLGWPCRNSARVLYVDGELPGAALQKRVNCFPKNPAQQFYVLCRDTFLLRRELPPDLGEAEGRQVLDRIIADCDPRLIILDSLSTLFRTGVENEAESWAPIGAWLMGHRWAGRSVILIHHEGRGGKPRGTSKREDPLDTMIGLKKVTEEGGDDSESVFDLTFTKHRDFFGKDAEPMRLHLSIVDGQVQWRHQQIRDVKRERIREMRRIGMTHDQIAKEVGVSRSRVSQIVSELLATDDESREG